MGCACGTYGERGLYRVLMREREGSNNFQDQGVDGLKILKRKLKKSLGMARTWLMRFRMGTLLASQLADLLAN